MDVTNTTHETTTVNISATTKVSVFHAAEEDDESAVRYFVEEKGVRLSESNYDDETAAHVAARNGNINILNILLTRDPTIISATNAVGDSPLFVAIESGHLHVVKLLVEEYNVNILERNSDVYGCTPIHIAAMNGQLAILRYFIEDRKGDVNIRNRLRETPAFSAAEKKHHHIMKYLVEEANANITKVDRNKDNVLYTTADENDLTLMRYLVDERKVELDLNYRNRQGATLVHRAAVRDRIDILTYLVGEKKADVNIPDNLNVTPLHSAIVRDHFQTCKYLIENGADTEFKDYRGMPPIHYASDKRIIQYMKNIKQKRDRRSLYEPLLSRSMAQRMLLPNKEIRRTETESFSLNSTIGYLSDEGLFNSFGLCYLQSILTVAEMVFRTTKNSLNHLPLLLSPKEIVRSRINPVAVIAVQTGPRLGKTRPK